MFQFCVFAGIGYNGSAMRRCRCTLLFLI